MLNKICIVGIGLVGSSMARAVRKRNLAKEIICIDRNQQHCERALALGIVDSASHDPALAANCELVFLAVPVGQMGNAAAMLAPHLSAGSILSDTGSVKAAVIEAVLPHVPAGIHFIPGHPIAGTENSGPEAGFAELFEGRFCLLTPLPDTDAAALSVLRSFWQALGSRVDEMDPAHHDRVLAITSHVPHLIAYTIVGTAADLATEMQAEVIRYSAGGFRDFTRLAASDPTMWRDVFLHNRGAVLEILQRFSEDLTALQRAIRHGEGDTLFDLFSRTRTIRREVIEQKQA